MNKYLLDSHAGGPGSILLGAVLLFSVLPDSCGKWTVFFPQSFYHPYTTQFRYMDGKNTAGKKPSIYLLHCYPTVYLLEFYYKLKTVYKSYTN